MENNRFFIPDELYIQGGKPAIGDIEISGAKNSILGLMCAALLTNEKVTLNNVPNISDVLDLGDIMKDLGIDVKFQPAQKILTIHAKKIKKNTLSEKVLKLRASYYLWGSLLTRFKNTGEFKDLKVLLPGGCGLGEKRKTDFHENLIKDIFGAEIKEEIIRDKPYLHLILPEKEPQSLNPIYATAKVSHGATFHWLLSVAGSKNYKMMYNSSLEPEVSNLIGMLQSMGLEIDGNERTGIVHRGNKRGLLKGTEYNVIPDRLEAATYALFAFATKGAIRLKGINYEHCAPWLSQLSQINQKGIYYSDDKTEVILNFLEREKFEGVMMNISPFPGMETDVQQIWAPVLSLASSTSTIVDIIWPGRYISLEELQNFGLKSTFKQIDVDCGQGTKYKALVANIKPSKLHAGTAEGMDLRGTAALILAASMTEGKSTIIKPEYSLRGYPNFIDNLKSLGINIKTSKSGRYIDTL